MIGRFMLLLLRLLVGLLAATTAVWFFVLRPLQKSWGVDPAEWSRTMPGDGLVPDAPMVETRGITIEAPPDQVWPWLVQMGFGRAGWYSYDKLDNRGASADRIVPEFQSLAVGDIMPAWPGGGFRVAAIEPGRSLSLFVDTKLVREQAAAAEAAEGAEAKAAEGAETETVTEAAGPAPRPFRRPETRWTAGTKAAGAMGEAAMPEFAASWTFVLDPLEGGRTRVIERIRAWAPQPSGAQQLALPMLGMGVFLMTRRQLLGLKERVERHPRGAEEVRAA
jgi:hypothetical protein